MSSSSSSAPTASLRRLTWLLDEAIRLPFGLRIGLDALLGLIPGVGDATTALIGIYAIAVGWKLGAPAPVLARMALNIGLDALIGAIPILGDLWDVGFASNTRNLQLLEQWRAQPARVHQRSSALLIGLVLGILAVATAAILVSIWLVSLLIGALAS